jgi:hypothetical protein
MALRPCKECKQQISSDAKVCPHCGKKQGTSAAVGCLALIGQLIVLGMIGSLTEQQTDNTPLTPPTAAQIQAKKQADEAARKAEEHYLKTPSGRLWKKHKDWSRDFCDAIVKRKVMTGMNPEQVRAAWGRPEHINRTVIPGHTDEQWVYGDTYLYFDDGILTSWQDSR